MRHFRRILTLASFALMLGVSGSGAWAATFKTEEEQVSDAIKGPGVTVVHFWAPWSENSKNELAKNGWSTFVDTNFEVKFIFVTSWSKDDGRAQLAKEGLAKQENFKLLLHPNSSRKDGDRFDRFLGLPVTSMPTTWVFRDGRLCYALNYGEVKFPLLQALVRDAHENWEK